MKLFCRQDHDESEDKNQKPGLKEKTVETEQTFDLEELKVTRKDGEEKTMKGVTNVDVWTYDNVLKVTAVETKEPTAIPELAGKETEEVADRVGLPWETNVVNSLPAGEILEIEVTNREKLKLEAEVDVKYLEYGDGTVEVLEVVDYNIEREVV